MPGVPAEASAETLEVPSRPVALLHSSANWDNGFTAIQEALKKINTELDKAGLKPAGRPITVFLETSDNGFQFEAMVPLAQKPDGKDRLGSEVKIGASPSGKAIKFQHRGSYEEIDSTYDLITAYLDEKGYEARNDFIEEYLTVAKTADDPNLEVDIYVFLK